MKEYNFKEYKKIYTDITISEEVISQKWDEMKLFLPEQDHVKSSYKFIPFSPVFLCVVLLLLASVGMVTASNAKPGSILYPVSKLTQQITGSITKRFQPLEPVNTPVKIHATVNLKPLPTPTITPTPPVEPTGKVESKTFHTDNNDKKANNNVLGSQTENNNAQVHSQDAQIGSMDNPAQEHNKEGNKSKDENLNNSHGNDNKNLGKNGDN